jgi:hypothetical protein
MTVSWVINLATHRAFCVLAATDSNTLPEHLRQHYLRRDARETARMATG